jgi:hypothetical protein
MRILILLLIGVCLMGSDPPRGWNALTDPDEGYSFNYPATFRLKRTSDFSRRDLEDPKLAATLELVSMEVDRAPSFKTFSMPSADGAKIEVVEEAPLFIIVAEPQNDRTVYRKLLLGKTKAFVLTAVFKNSPDAKLFANARHTAIRILKSLRRVG